MTDKLYCPYCGRCVGECSSSDLIDTVHKVLTKRPNRLKKNQFIHNMHCYKCKEQIYISMEFTKQHTQECVS